MQVFAIPKRFPSLMKSTSISVIALIGGSLLSLVCPTAAQALTVTVDSQTYNITVTEPIKYTENVSLLQSQPWWENFNLSDKLAKAVFEKLDTPNSTNNGATGPLFAFTASGGAFASVDFNAYISKFGGTVTTNSVAPDSLRVFAIQETAPPVPGPLPLFGAAAAFGMSRRLRQRIRRAS